MALNLSPNDFPYCWILYVFNHLHPHIQLPAIWFYLFNHNLTKIQIKLGHMAPFPSPISFRVKNQIIASSTCCSRCFSCVWQIIWTYLNKISFRSYHPWSKCCCTKINIKWHIWNRHGILRECSAHSVRKILRGGSILCVVFPHIMHCIKPDHAQFNAFLNYNIMLNRLKFTDFLWKLFVLLILACRRNRQNSMSDIICATISGLVWNWHPRNTHTMIKLHMEEQ